MLDGYELAVRVVHITDLHLFVTREGTARPPADLLARTRWAAAGLRRLGHLGYELDGLNVHNSTALRALRRDLNRQIASHRAGGTPVIVIQSGDVEAFGRHHDAGGDEFSGYEYLVGRVWPELYQAGASEIVEVYGNHDIWPSTWPLLAPGRSVSDGAAAISALPQFADLLPDVRRIDIDDSLQVGIYRLNTVSTHRVDAMVASGVVCCHPPELDNDAPQDALTALEHCALPVGASLPVELRVLVCHHPPHFFQATGSVQGWTTGRLEGAEELGHAVEELRIHVIAVGHRHLIDPRAPWQEGSQPPLPAGTLQLAAGSPTQSPGASSHPDAYTICDYGLWVSVAQPSRLAVTRTILRYAELDREFAAAESGDEVIAREIAL